MLRSPVFACRWRYFGQAGLVRRRLARAGRARRLQFRPAARVFVLCFRSDARVAGFDRRHRRRLAAHAATVDCQFPLVDAARDCIVRRSARWRVSAVKLYFSDRLGLFAGVLLARRSVCDWSYGASGADLRALYNATQNAYVFPANTGWSTIGLVTQHRSFRVGSGIVMVGGNRIIRGATQPQAVTTAVNMRTWLASFSPVCPWTTVTTSPLYESGLRQVRVFSFLSCNVCACFVRVARASLIVARFIYLFFVLC